MESEWRFLFFLQFEVLLFYFIFFFGNASCTVTANLKPLRQSGVEHGMLQKMKKS